MGIRLLFKLPGVTVRKFTLKYSKIFIDSDSINSFMTESEAPVNSILLNHKKMRTLLF